MSAKKLSEWAKENGVHYRTAMIWMHEGKLPVQVVQTPGGHYRVVDNTPVPLTSGKSVLYGRVSSHDQMSLGERTYHCEACGSVIDRDLNASINLKLLAGSSPVSACCPGSSGLGALAAETKLLAGQEPRRAEAAYG